MPVDHTITLWDYKAGATAVPSNASAKAGNGVIRLWRRLRHRLNVASTRAELGMMSDETLRDLALSRCQLDYIAEQSAQRGE